MIVDNSTNINKWTTTFVWPWKSRFWLETSKQCGGVKPVNEIPILPHQYRYKQKQRNLNRFASNKKKPHTITKMNNNELFPQIHNNHNQNPDTTIIIPYKFYGKTEIDKEIIFFLVYNSFWNQIIGSNEKWTS